METRPYVSWETIGSFMTQAFAKLGVPEDEAAICADVLMESDRRGIESHGCNRFKPIYIDRINAGIQKPVTEFEVIRETPTTAVVDGHDGMGMIVGTKAMNMAIEKAKKYGMGMVAARNSTHYGIAGYYATMATKENMIGITGTNARPSIAPTFGVENMLGTNPLTIGLPTDEEFPFVIDCATSITQRGKIEFYDRVGKDTPKGMVVGRDGSALTDSKQILTDLTQGKAALTPLGGIGEELAGYKGYGYAIESDVPEGMRLLGVGVEIESAIRNLLSNAVRYTPEGGEITLEWLDQNGRGAISVVDTGIGIPAEHLPRLTERFYRVDRARSRVTGGTGLGLAIVKHIANRHGAEFLIESKAGKGSRFTLRFSPPRVIRPEFVPSPPPAPQDAS